MKVLPMLFREKRGVKTSKRRQKTFEINRHENVSGNRSKKMNNNQKTSEIQFLLKLRASSQKR